MNKIWKLSIASVLSFSLFSCPSPTNSNPSSTPSAGSSSTPNPGTSVAPSAGATATPVPAPISKVGLTFSYVGLDADKTSPGDNIVPDKANDLHFTGSFNFASESEITLVAINKYENGKVNRTIGWASGTLINWNVAVEANGKPLNTTKTKFLNKLSGNVKFDFYGSDLPGFGLTTAGTQYELDITYKDASGKETIASQVTTL
jgi:hypothetical protein